MKMFLLVIVLLLIIFPSFSQGPGLPGEDPDMPVDGGMFALMAAGIAYGLKTIRKNKL